MNRRLYRSRTDSVIGGVAGGVAEYLDIDPSIVRIVWAVLAIVTGGIFFVLYIVMWIVVPEGPPQGSYPAGYAGAPGDAAPLTGTVEGGEPTLGAGVPGEAAAPSAQPVWDAGYRGPAYPRRRGTGSGGMIFGLILIGLGIWFLVDQFVPGIDRDLLWPIGLVLLGLVLLAVSMRRRPG